MSSPKISLSLTYKVVLSVYLVSFPVSYFDFVCPLFQTCNYSNKFALHYMDNMHACLTLPILPYCFFFLSSYTGFGLQKDNSVILIHLNMFPILL